MHGVLHEISTNSVYIELAIDALLDFFDLVAEGEVEFEVFFDFLDAVHDSGMVLDADLGGYLSGAET